jgi:hypothetical protein
VITAIRYYLRLLTSRQAVLAPVLAYLALVAVNYSGTAGPAQLAQPPLQAAVVTVVALMPVTAWLTRLVATAESEPFAEVTLVTLGSSARRQAARSAAAMSVAVLLGGAATLWGAVANPAPYPATTVITLLGMHLAEACAGAGIGILIAPPLRTRVGTAVAGVTVLTATSLVVPWLPPLNPLVRTVFQHPSPGPGLLLLVTGQAALVGLASAALGTAVVRARRRG